MKELASGKKNIAKNIAFNFFKNVDGNDAKNRI